MKKIVQCKAIENAHVFNVIDEGTKTVSRCHIMQLFFMWSRQQTSVFTFSSDKDDHLLLTLHTA